MKSAKDGHICDGNRGHCAQDCEVDVPNELFREWYACEYWDDDADWVAAPCDGSLEHAKKACEIYGADKRVRLMKYSLEQLDPLKATPPITESESRIAALEAEVARLKQAITKFVAARDVLDVRDAFRKLQAAASEGRQG